MPLLPKNPSVFFLFVCFYRTVLAKLLIGSYAEKCNVYVCHAPLTSNLLGQHKNHRLQKCLFSGRR